MDIIITKNTKKLKFEYSVPNGYGETHYIPPYLVTPTTNRGAEYLSKTGYGPDVKVNKTRALSSKGLRFMRMEQDPRKRYIFDNGATIKIDF